MVEEKMPDPMTNSLREGLQAKYPYLMNETTGWIMLGIVVIALIICFWIMRKRKHSA